jgi:predicted O-methyltransferase YrrM
MTILYARELYTHANYEKALEECIRYLKMTYAYNLGGDDDWMIHQRSYACRVIANSYIMLGKPTGEILAWMIRSVGESPASREPWMYLSKIWDQLDEGLYAYAAAKQGTAITNVLNSAELEAECWDQRAVDLLDRSRKKMEEQLYYDNDIGGWMTQQEMIYLLNAAKKMESIVEIGSWKGKSTHALLTGCKRGIVHAIDHFKGSPSDGYAHQEAFDDPESVYMQFLGNVGHFPNLKVHKSSSEDAAKEFEDMSIDMVFIDAEHTYDAVKKDIELWFPKCKKLICGHDYNFPTVKEAVLTFFPEEVIRVHGSIWSYKL